MKTITIMIAAIAIIAAGSAFTYKTLTKSGATVEQTEGIYIFYKSKPTSEYDYLGTVNCPAFVNSVKPEGMLTAMLKKLKKDFTTADAIIFSDASMEKADAVKLKE